MIDTGSDVGLYASIIQAIFSGKVPFVNFYFEYPPLIFLSFLLPGAWYFLKNFSLAQFAKAFYFQNFILIFLTAAIVGKYLHKRAVWVDVTTLLVLLALFPVATERVDLFICFITIGGLFLLKGQRNVSLGFFLIILAGFMKIYALVFLPILLIHYWKANDRNSIKKLLAIFCVFFVAHLLVFSINPKGFEFLFNYHKNRGFELESIYAGTIILLPILQLQAVFGFGGFNVIFPGIEKLLILPVILVLSGIGWLYWKFLKSISNTWEETVRFCVLTLVWFVVFNKVFSVQFLIWFLPLVKLLNFEGKKQTLINLMLVLISIAGTLIFPYGFINLIYKRYAIGSLICIKNLLVLILFGLIYKSGKGGGVDKRAVVSKI